MGKGVRVHLIDHSLCGAPAFVQMSTVDGGMATVFVNLRKYWLMFCTKAVTFSSWWWCSPQLDGLWSEVRADPLPWLPAKFLCYSLERELQGLDERQQRSYRGSFKFCQGVVDQGKRLLFYFPCGKTPWRSSNSFTKINLEVCFHCLAPSPISRALRTIWVGQQEGAFTQTVFQAPHIEQGCLLRKADLTHFSHMQQWVLVTLYDRQSSPPLPAASSRPFWLYTLCSPLG